MNNPSKSVFDNALTAQEEQEKALQHADRRLSVLHVDYPYYDYKMTPVQNYDALREYSKLHASLAMEYRAMNAQKAKKSPDIEYKEYRSWVM